MCLCEVCEVVRCVRCVCVCCVMVPFVLQVFGFFKDIVLKAYKDEERTNSSKWIKG